MKAAAVATRYGWNPMELLALEEADLQIAMAVLEESSRIEREYVQSIIDALSSKTAHLTAHHIIGWLARAFKR